MPPADIAEFVKSAESADVFIEYPSLNRPALDWRNQSEPLLSDFVIALDDGREDNKKYQVHLRVLCMSADFLYKLAVQGNSKDQSHDLKMKCSSQASPVGDITLKLQDGSCFRMGLLSQQLRTLKEQIQDHLGILSCEQRLLHTNGSSCSGFLEDDWKSLAGHGLRTGDTLLLQQQPWQRFDSSTKTLTLKLPELCSR